MRRLGFCLVTFLLPLGLSAPVLALEPTILTANGGPKPEEYEGVGQPVVPPLLAQNGRLYGLDHFHNVFSLNDYPGHSWELVDLTDLGLKIVSGPLVQDTRKDRGSLYVAGFRAESLFDELDTGRLVRLDADGTHPEPLVDLIEPNGVLVIDGNRLYGLDKGPEGNGRLFAIDLDAQTPSLETLHTFSAGPQGQRQYPNGMILGSDGWLYGVTAYVRGLPYAPGTSSALDTPTGTVYRIDPSLGTESFQILHTFTLQEGEIPWQTRYGDTYHMMSSASSGRRDYVLAWLVEGPEGFLYGTLGVGNCTTLGTGTSLYNLPLCQSSESADPERLDRYLSAPPHYDGPNLHGAVYRLAREGEAFHILHHFTGGEGGSQPRGPLVAADGKIYGTTLSGGPLSGGRALPGEPVELPPEDQLSYRGTLYSIDPARVRISDEGVVEESGFELEYGFINGSDQQGNVRYDGYLPLGLTLGHNGKIYGANNNAGGYFINHKGNLQQRTGTIYRLSNEPEAHVSVTITPGEIEVGDTALLEWSTVDASYCQASGGVEGDGWAGAKADSGYLELTLEAGNYYYTLTCESTLEGGGQVGDVASLGVGAQDRTTDEQTREYGNGGGSPSWWLLAGMGVLLAARSKRSGRR
ncbi:hypothetical protein [Alloalcanivorax xenomutans]|uniref:hypothetical protein n=1 Tax=Alloalcanivorax xenomutans TaxID=1094342 RepID=UPI0007A73CC0|nr:hypothetical protein [Alloalcanivorax xenomutans]KYZ86465.1 hypothetical protein A3Q32_16955 [Alcanivorax sp. KX64203]WOA29938.1 hypothetical protein RVY87_13725 [Alloalcanivorax xenomutans]